MCASQLTTLGSAPEGEMASSRPKVVTRSVLAGCGVPHDNRLTVRLSDGRTDRRYLTADEIDRALSEIFLLPTERSWRAAIERAATAEIAG